LMGKRGPARRPTEISRRMGNPGRRPLNAREPTPAAGVTPYAPRWLGKAAKREWERLGRDLHKCGLLKRVDRNTFATYCTVFARYVEAERRIAEQGIVLFSGDEGNPLAFVYNPHWVIANKCIGQLKTLLREMGLSPSARSTIEVEAPVEAKSVADDLADELFRRRVMPGTDDGAEA